MDPGGWSSRLRPLEIFEEFSLNAYEGHGATPGKTTGSLTITETKGFGGGWVIRDTLNPKP